MIEVIQFTAFDSNFSYLIAFNTSTDQDGNEIGIGWKVVAEPIDDIRNGPFTVYAICACVDPKGCPKATP